MNSVRDDGDDACEQQIHTWTSCSRCLASDFFFLRVSVYFFLFHSRVYLSCLPDTRLHHNIQYCDVKLIQTMMLMHELRTMLEDSVTSFRPGATKADPNSVPLLFCCDLNSTPDSGVIEFLATGRVAADHVDFKGLGYQDCLKRLSSTESSVSSSSSKGPEFAHPFKIACAYADGSIPFTNYS